MDELGIRIFQTKDKSTEIQVVVQSDSVWLSQKQMSELFEKDSDTIGLHLRNIYKSGELVEKATTEKYSVVQKEGNRNVKRTIKLYNLDAIISVGYKVNSQRGVQFRIWANQVIKDYLIKGFAINEKRLKTQIDSLNSLKETVRLLTKVTEQKKLTGDETEGLLKIVSDYAYALDVLDQYDYQNLIISDTSDGELNRITYEEAIQKISQLRNIYGNKPLFGKEKDDSFKSSISTICQTFDKKDLYPSIEEKAANLLYLVTKNHSFVDGNKRIAAFLFLYFLEKNSLLFKENGEKRIPDNALVALTLMIAVSQPSEKETMIKVIVNLINKRINAT
ncbi:MAG: virulence protein RhuM/Fic/DOC family protein [Bacteroidales bacterium]|nr:virulence protein RhuM/Fic/DOC family protein [Bacteroidales bacterium]